jgi:tRNA(fMet)-specific endonuclease VapC
VLHLLDTSVAILLRDLDSRVADRVAKLERMPALSVLTVVELQGGAAASVEGREERRRSVEEMLGLLPVLVFGTAEAAIYGRIVDQIGFSRPKIIDRMIAAHALALNATLATLNPRDFKNIPGLELEDWSL